MAHTQLHPGALIGVSYQLIGSGSAAIGGLTCAATGIVGEAGVGLVEFSRLAGSAAGVVGETGVGQASVGRLALSAAGTITETGAGSSDFGRLACSATGDVIPAYVYLVSLVTVTNVSRQMLLLPYSTIDRSRNITTIKASRDGVLTLMPGRSVTIELERLPDGEIDHHNALVRATYSAVDLRMITRRSGRANAACRPLAARGRAGIAVGTSSGSASFRPVTASGTGSLPIRVTLVSITNRSRQLVRIPYSSIDPSRSVSPIVANRQGTLDFMPGRSATIELERVPDGEIDRLVGDKLVYASRSRVRLHP